MEQNYDNLVHVDENSQNENGVFRRLRHLLREQFSFKNPYMKLVLLRLPSIIFADFILMNSDQIMSHFYPEETKPADSSFFNIFVVYSLSRFALVSLLLVCVLLFVLSLDYVLNTFKCITLVSLPFVFTYLMDELNRQVPEPNGALSLDAYIGSIQVPKFVIIILIYALIVSLTIHIYQDIYKNIIFDKFNVHGHYLASRESGNAALVNYLESLANVQYEGLFTNQEENNAPNPRAETVNDSNTDTTTPISVSFEEIYNNSRFKWFHINKRRIFIITYSVLSIVFNEIPQHLFVSEKSDESEQDKRPFNIMSLGYLLLLTYDLGVNMDQMLLRSLIKLKILSRLVSQYGLHNFLSFNWFQRLRVPFLLRVYFLVRTYIFTLNFIFYYGFYAEFDAKLAAQNLTETSSLFYSVVNFIKRLGGSTDKVSQGASIFEVDYGAHPREEYLIASSAYHFASILPFRTTLYASTSKQAFSVSGETVLIYFRMLVLNLTTNLVGIACTTSILSYQFFLIGQAMQYMLNAKSDTPALQRQNMNDNDLGNVGDVAAILFFLLSIQSGLSSLPAKHRIEKFFKNYSLLFIAILHYFHATLDTQLMGLTASSKLNWRSEKHFRVIGLSATLILIPIGILTYLIRNYTLSTWFLAATAFNLELIVKMSVSLISYLLFSIEASQFKTSYEQFKKDVELNSKTISFSEKLDDYLYYVKAFGHTFEFFIALVLFFNGGYILFFESYGAIRAIMMCIHAYFHIWCQARKGWSAFMKRRTAISKLRQLAVFNKANFMSLMKRQRTASDHETSLDSTEESDEYELRTHDVCAICFFELSAHEARITSCHHIFHFICLRKWLYLQETCPMCHQLVCQPQTTATAAT
jgi:hypothetical protein